MCHETTQWVDSLPIVLLGLRTSLKEDINTSAAELVFGTTLRIPGEFLVDSETTDPQQIYVNKLREHMRAIRPVPTAHHSKRKPFTHKTLYTCSHVLLKIIGGKKSLDQPFDGPHKVLERLSDVVFKIEVNGEPMTVSTERLKPVFLEEPSQQTATVQSDPSLNSPAPQSVVQRPLTRGLSPTMSVPQSSYASTSLTSQFAPPSSSLAPQSIHASSSPQPSTSTQSARRTPAKTCTQLLVPLAPPTLTPRPDAPPRTYPSAKQRKTVAFAT